MLSWVILERFGLTIIPEVLNTLSEAQLDAAMPRYLLANSDSFGNVLALVSTRKVDPSQH